MFEEFSPTCRKAIAFARRLALHRGETELSPSRLLEGLLGTQPCRARQILETLGIDLQEVVQRIQDNSPAPAEEGTASGIPFSRECQIALERATRYQQRFNHDRAGTDHVLLGLYSMKKREIDELFDDSRLDAASLANRVELGRRIGQMSRMEQILDDIPSARIPAIAELGERFTDDARLVVREAFRLAQSHANAFLAVEHLLLALVRLVREGRLRTSLFAIRNIDLEEITPGIEAKLGSVTTIDEGGIDFTFKAKKVIELAIQEAYLAGASSVGADHIILGLLGLEKGFPGEILHTDLAEARLRILGTLSSGPPCPAPSIRPCLDLSRLRVDRGILHRLPRETALLSRAVPIHIEGDVMTVAMADPSDEYALANLRSAVALKIAPIQASSDQIQGIIEQYA